MSTQRPPTISPSAAAHWQRIAPAATPWLHEEVASRMIDRLQWINLQPKSWTHWGAVRGGQQAHVALLGKYPESVCFMPLAGEFIANTAIKNIAKNSHKSSRWKLSNLFQNKPKVDYSSEAQPAIKRIGQ